MPFPSSSAGNIIVLGGHSGAASFRAIVNPMVNWIWAGGVVLLLGAIVTMWPSEGDKGRSGCEIYCGICEGYQYKGLER